MDLKIWNDQLAEAVQALGSAAFMGRLFDLVGLITPFDMSMLFGYRGRGKPLSLHQNIDTAINHIIVDNYLKGPYLLDPFFEAIQSSEPGALLVMQDLAPDQFKKSAYFHQHYALTGIHDEVGFVFAAADDITAVLSLTRAQGSPRFRRGDIRRLADAAPLIAALATQHWTRHHALPEEPVPQTSIAQTLSGFAAITPREAEITALILKGHSTLSVAANLGISDGTVKVHRKNIYRKLNISSQGELFSLFLSGAHSQLR